MPKQSSRMSKNWAGGIMEMSVSDRENGTSEGRVCESTEIPRDSGRQSVMAEAQVSVEQQRKTTLEEQEETRP